MLVLLPFPRYSFNVCNSFKERGVFMNQNRKSSVFPVVVAVLVSALLTFWGTYFLLGLRDRTQTVSNPNRPSQTESAGTQEPSSPQTFTISWGSAIIVVVP